MPLTHTIRRLASPVIDVIIPPQCCVSGQPITSDDMGLAPLTRTQIAQLAAQPYCHHCGLTVGPFELHDKRDPCGRCGSREVGVNRIARVGTYSPPLTSLVQRLKFGHARRGHWEIATILAPFLFQSLQRISELTKAPVDALVPVPLHWQRRARRGFNQAEELARELCRLSAWPVIHALKRNRPTHEQALLDSAHQRVENLRGAFIPLSRAVKGSLAGKHIWLVDNVSTTGATLHAAAIALKKIPLENRPASINAAVVCITDHQSIDPASADPAA